MYYNRKNTKLKLYYKYENVIDLVLYSFFLLIIKFDIYYYSIIYYYYLYKFSILLKSNR